MDAGHDHTPIVMLEISRLLLLLLPLLLRY